MWVVSAWVGPVCVCGWVFYVCAGGGVGEIRFLNVAEKGKLLAK